MVNLRANRRHMRRLSSTPRPTGGQTHMSRCRPRAARRSHHAPSRQAHAGVDTHANRSRTRRDKRSLRLVTPSSLSAAARLPPSPCILSAVSTAPTREPMCSGNHVSPGRIKGASLSDALRLTSISSPPGDTPRTNVRHRGQTSRGVEDLVGAPTYSG